MKKRALACACVSFMISAAPQLNKSFGMYDRKQTIFHQAQIDSQQGRLKDALFGFQKVIDLDPSCAVAYFNCGTVLARMDEHKKALSYFDNVLTFTPHFASMVHFQRGNSLYHCERTDEALQAFRASIALDPDCADAQAYVAKIELENKCTLAAMPHALKAAQLDAQYAAALMTVAVALRDEYHFQQAAECFEVAAQCTPLDFRAYLHLADIYNLLQRPEDALAAYQKTYSLNSQCYEAAHNIGMILLNQEKRYESYQWLQHALSIKSDFICPHIGLSCLYLSEGDFVRGWAEYEWRLVDAILPFVTQVPRWDGSSLDNKTIMLYAEQGFGDTFHFIRYAKWIKQHHNAQIIVLPQPPLAQLLKQCPYIDRIIEPTDTECAFDCYASIMSLPYLCGATLETIPLDIPYIHPQADLIEQWAQELAHDANLKIGICWHVDPSHDCLTYFHGTKKLQVSVPKRSIALRELARISDVAGISIYSLQRFNGLDEIEQLEHPECIKQFGDDFDAAHGRFMDTAAVIKNLDLVITVDTSIAHLAGALGVRTWILLPYQAEWRWLMHRTDSPWYPSVRLFRQPRDGDWASVMDEVMQALRSISAQQMS